uniref:Uncharacterized protein n=1 Tax=Setaria italica TaxID=4555 RepID=K3ZGK5_SETIT
MQIWFNLHAALSFTFFYAFCFIGLITFLAYLLVQHLQMPFVLS